MKANKKFFLLVLLILIGVFGYFWWRADFTLEFSKFFAAGNGPTVVINSGGTASHNDRISVSWSKQDAVECHALSGSIDTGGRTEGTTDSDPVDACAGTNHVDINIECSFSDGSVGNTSRRVTIDQSSCPSAPLKHLECRSNACVQVNGGGGDQCSNNGDCATSACNATIRTCNGNSVFQHYSNCAGADIQSCPNGCDPGNGSNASCMAPPAQHLACRSAACVMVNGAGAAECSNDSECDIPVGQRPGCNVDNVVRTGAFNTSPSSVTGHVRNNSTDACKIIVATYKINRDLGQARFDYTAQILAPGEGAAITASLPDCYAQTDMVVGSASDSDDSIAPVDPIGNLQPSNFISATWTQNLVFCDGVGPPPAPTHSVCQSNACVSVAGAGANECATNANCAATTALSCTTITPTVSVGQSAQFSAAGGTGSYVWFAPGGTIPTGTANPFSTAYTTPGSKTVTVTSGGNQVTCPVTVTPASTALICTPASVNLGIGQDQVFTASNGTGAFAWSAPGGAPATGGDVASFTTQYATAGTKAITVTRGTETAVCQAIVSTTIPALACAPITQNVALNSPATVTTTGGTGVRAWSAPGGTPATAGDVASFTTQYATVGTKDITVTRGSETVVCQVVVSTIVPPLSCAPVSQTVGINVPATIVSSGGSGIISWSAPGGSPTSGGNFTSFTTQYATAGTRTVTLTRGSETVDCVVAVTGGGGGSNPALDIEKRVRNVTQGTGESDSTNANPGDTVEFSLRVSSVGSGTVTNVVVRDALPAGLSYIPGSTTVDGAVAADGVVASGLSLGNMSSGRTITVRFRAVVAPATFFAPGTSVLTNTGYADGSNVPQVSDIAFVTVVNVPANLSISLVKMGRNITRGETTEHTPVNSSPGQQIEFVLRVRNTSLAPLTNVVLRDIVPVGITPIAGSVRVGGVVAPDTLTAGGLNLGTLAPGQEVVVVFSGNVAPASQLPSGTTTLINTVTVTATGVGPLTAQLPIIIAGTVVVVPPIDTGPGESTVLALIISGIITLLYVGYTSTDTYRRHEAGEIVKEDKDDTFNFRR